jgi:hypothetical protein
MCIQINPIMYVVYIVYGHRDWLIKYFVEGRV